MQGRPGDAAVYFEELTLLHPDAALHWNNLGSVLREAGRSEPAEAAYRRAQALAPRDSQIPNRVAPASAVTIQLIKATTRMTASLSTKVPGSGSSCGQGRVPGAGSDCRLPRGVGVGSRVLGRIDGRSEPQGHGGGLHGLVDHGYQLGRQGAQVDLLA